MAVRVGPRPRPTRRSTRASPALDKRHAPVWLSLPAPDAQEDVEPWRIALRALLEKHGSALTILEVTVDRQPARVASFAVQIAATEVRASRDTIRLALGGPAMTDPVRRAEIYSRDLSPYVDLLAIPDGRQPERSPAWLHQIDPLARIVLTAAAPVAPRRIRPAAWSTACFEDLGTDVAMHAWRAADVTAAALRALAPSVADLLTARDLDPR